MNFAKDDVEKLIDSIGKFFCNENINIRTRYSLLSDFDHDLWHTNVYNNINLCYAYEMGILLVYYDFKEEMVESGSVFKGVIRIPHKHKIFMRKSNSISTSVYCVLNQIDTTRIRKSQVIEILEGIKKVYPNFIYSFRKTKEDSNYLEEIVWKFDEKGYETISTIGHKSLERYFYS